ncbi:MAG TPA: hypothetical protein VKE74_08100 [Gemmataceae bacterium]|nr:hypothetical protein [Gemmataceae bacterium]
MVAEVMPSRPTILVAGQPQHDLADGLQSLVVAEDAGGLYRCEAVFANWGLAGQRLGFLLFDRRTVDFGKPFQVKIGSGVLFDGRVMGMEANFPETRPPELVVLAEDRLQDMRMTRRTRVFENTTDADLARQLANDHALTPDVDLPGPSHPVLVQLNLSDLAFLRDRVRQCDGELWVDGSKLIVRPRGGANSPRKLVYGDELREFTVLADLAGQRTAVIATGWDVAAKAAIRHEATDSVVTRELRGGTSGASILASAIGKRPETIAHSVPLTDAEATATAEAAFRRMARRFVIGRGLTNTDVRLQVGAAVELTGLGPLFSGVYELTTVRHLFDGRLGLRSEFTAERPGLGTG